MLELIFQGFIEWAYGLILESWQYFSTSLLDIMSLDFAYLKTHVPVIPEIMQVLLAVGWALLIGNLAFQAIKSMASGLGFEGEDPKLLFARTFIFAFLLMASPQICEIILEITSRVVAALNIPDAVNVTLVDESIFGPLTASWLLVIICGLIIMFKVLRLLLEIAERYVILAVLTITAPLAFAMGGSRSTSEIFSGWCRMYGSMCILMGINVVFFKLLLSVLSTVPSGLDVLPWMVLIMAIVKVARKADAIVTRIGLNPAITGDNLGVRFPGALTYMVMRGITSQVTKTVGKSSGGTGGGRAPNTPPGGSGGGPGSGRVGATGGGPGNGSGGSSGAGSFGSRNEAAVGTAGFTQMGGKQDVIYMSSGRQDVAQQNSSRQETVQQGGGLVQTGTPAGQGRKSAVPPGARRAPCYLRAGQATASGGKAIGLPGKGADSAPEVLQAGAQVQNTARQESASRLQGARGATTGRQSDAAGMQHRTAARFTHTAAQTVQGGSVSGTIQAAEQNNISIGQQERGDGTAIATGGHAAAQSPGNPSRPRGESLQGKTRFTHRENTTAGEKKAPISSQAAPPPAAGRPGTAGISSSSLDGERPKETARHSRNIPAAGTPAPKDGRTSGTVRQEVREVTSPAMPTIRGSAPKLHPDTAGSTRTDHKAAQGHQAARERAERAKSIPFPGGASGQKRAASTGAAAQGRIAPKHESDTQKRPRVRPPRQKRGPDHGKS